MNLNWLLCSLCRGERGRGGRRICGENCEEFIKLFLERTKRSIKVLFFGILDFLPCHTSTEDCLESFERGIRCLTFRRMKHMLRHRRTQKPQEKISSQERVISRNAVVLDNKSRDIRKHIPNLTWKCPN